MTSSRFGDIEIYDFELPLAPYPGLRPFFIHEWPIFFGRERTVDDIMNQLLQKHLVLVHGDSGCGKSSLVGAGVLKLQQETSRGGGAWQFLVMRPGGDPLRYLAQAFAELGDISGRDQRLKEIRRILELGRDAPTAIVNRLRRSEQEYICLIVDQLEELFHFSQLRDRAEVDLFVDILVGLQENPPPGLYAILTMRSEYLGVCARFRGLAEAVNRTQYLLPRMEHAALLRAIREPARLYGGEVSRELAERLIADAGGAQDQLPLIQHGLMLLWRRAVETLPRVKGFAEASVPFRNESRLHDAVPPPSYDRGPAWRLDLEDYKGGALTTLLSDHADQVMAEAAPDTRREKIVEHLFRALTDIDAQGHAIRRPQALAKLVAVTGSDEDTLRGVIDHYRADGVSFLTPYGDAPIAQDTIIDISHEALIRCWRKIADAEEGWLRREFRDGLIWKTLRVQAQKSETLSAAATADREAWLQTLPSSDWCERYGSGWADVQRLLDASRKARNEAAAGLAEAQERLAEAERQKAREAEARAREVDAMRRRSRHLALVAAVSTVAALIGWAVAFWR